MEKLEQTIKDVELGLRIAKGTDCGLFKTSVKSAEQILELLKEQQPKKVVYDINGFTHLPVSFCPSCGEGVDMYAYGRNDLKQTFCPYCGQALDWKDGDGE